MDYPDTGEPDQPWTVTQLNRAAAQLLGEHFWSVWVTGEVSNFSAPSSGHWYFSLKDAQAQVRCAMFKNAQRGAQLRPENGQQIKVRAAAGLYEPRGEYQLLVDKVAPLGAGGLQQAFAALKAKLAVEGLFEAAHKQPLPTMPKRIGVITSSTGAAVRDILTVLKRRFPAAEVWLYPVAVQGDQAKHELVRALALANREPLCDVLIVGRGGGSLEDLWAFNEEMVARAIFASRIPVIAAVGHETDFTIADFVADVRAPTPSAAAELATPDGHALLVRFHRFEQLLQQQLRYQLNQQRQKCAWLAQRLETQHPRQRLLRNAQRVDELELRLQQSINMALRGRQQQLAVLDSRLSRHHPAARLEKWRQQCAFLEQRLGWALTGKLERQRQRLVSSSQTLQAVSPLATLNRGYALAIKPVDGQVVRGSAELGVGDALTVRLGQGSVSAEVVAVHAT